METGPDNDGQDVEKAAYDVSASGYNVNEGQTASTQSWSPAIMSDAEVIKAMGRHPMEIMSPTFPAEANAYRDAVGRQQALQFKQKQDEQRRMAETAKRYNAMGAEMDKKSDPAYVAQQVYSQLGNLGAARVISKSNGAALFQYGEELNLGKAGSFYVVPGGYLYAADANGNPVRRPASEAVKAAGVSVVPFLSGDEAAIEFRRSAARASSVIEMLDQLEDLYDSKGVLLPVSDAKSRAAQIESQLPTAVSQLKSGSNSSSGISDFEQQAIQDSLPKRTNLLELNYNSRNKLQMTREQLRRIIFDRARRNGIEFMEIARQPDQAGASPRADGTTKPPTGVINGSPPR